MPFHFPRRPAPLSNARRDGRVRNETRRARDAPDPTICRAGSPRSSDAKRSSRRSGSCVETAPLVSLVGTGGAGKTRIAVEVGATLLNRFPDGVWFVELAPLSDPALVAHALAATLRVPESPNRPLLETLVTYLAQKHALLIFDNCEHVISQAARGSRHVAGASVRPSLCW